MQITQANFPPETIAVKLAVAAGVGMLIGFEREWSHKDAGVRTFAITCILGTLCSLIGLPYAITGLAAVIGLAMVLSTRNAAAGRQLEITTAIVLVSTVALGILIGLGHLFTPVAAAIVITMLLSMKEQFRRMTGGIQVMELRGGVLLCLIGFVIYPALPDRFIDRWKLINPREAWVTVIVVAAIGFMNYVFLRVYSRRGIYYAAVLGGLVNSTATVAELADWIKSPGADPVHMGVTISMLTTVAMFLRNFAILAIFSLPSAKTAATPLLLMMVVSIVLTWFSRPRQEQRNEDLKLDSPVALSKILKFGLIFLAIEIAGTLAQRHFGEVGFLFISIIGGLVSSASTAAAAAHLASRGQLTPYLAGTGAVLTSITSALVNLPVIYRGAPNKTLAIRLAWYTVLLAVIGISALALQGWLLF
jgi:uncharacterized membrane protein (DUF4010 family)